MRSVPANLRVVSLAVGWRSAVVAGFAAIMMSPQLTADEPPASAVVHQINSQVELRWQAENVVPADDCNDEIFVRRVYLDLAGRIPTMEERRRFLEDAGPTKRSDLVDRLLSGEDHVQHFADTFDTLLMGRGGERRYDERRKHEWRAWLERVFRENRPWNEVAADMLLARPDAADERGAVWFLYERRDDHQKIAEAVAPAFFGIRVECAQCHDHMIATEIEQRHYWGLVAFFNRSKNTDTPNGPRVSESAIGGFSDFADLGGSSSPNLLTFFASDPVEEVRPAADEKQEDTDDLYVPASLEGDPRVPGFSRRERFVHDVLLPHPLVARAFVNRMWALLLGRGIVHPFDQMDSGHPPSHPELLDWLARDFQESGYDIRRLVRAIALSRPYALSSVRPESADDPALFAWALERPLTAEQLARSMQVAARGGFQNDHPLVAHMREAMPDVMPEHTVTTVGNALFLTNHDAVNEFIAASDADDHLMPRVRAMSSGSEKAEALFEAIFGRMPDAEEYRVADEYLSAANAKGPSDVTNRWCQVVWAMLTSAEFRFNH